MKDREDFLKNEKENLKREWDPMEIMELIEGQDHYTRVVIAIITRYICAIFNNTDCGQRGCPFRKEREDERKEDSAGSGEAE